LQNTVGSRFGNRIMFITGTLCKVSFCCAHHRKSFPDTASVQAVCQCMEASSLDAEVDNRYFENSDAIAICWIY